PLVSISNAQRLPLPKVNFAATILHGLPLELHRPTFDPRGGYLAFLGRISPEKGPERAIHIARAMGIPIKIAAKVDKVDEGYFRECVAPLLSGPGVEFIGEINERQKSQFLGEALALLFPIDWPEPFGLTMIEAMACGAPTLAFRRGSVPEIIDDGVTGVIVDGMEQAAAALPRVLGLDRRAIRRRRLIPQLPGLPNMVTSVASTCKNKAGTILPPRPVMPDFPTSLIDFQRRFLDEAACAAWLFEARWPAGFCCPACAHEKGWPHGGKPFPFGCAACGKQTSVTAGTILHGSKLSLTVWFWAAYLMATHSNGISALQLQSQLSLGSYKSAWLLCAKLRRAMVAPGRALLSGLAEVDETELPLRGKDDPVTGGGGRSGQGKMLVAG